MAAALYRYCSSFLGFAEASGWVTASLLPRKGLRTIAPAVAPRQRVVSDAELVAIWNASAELELKPRVFTRLLVLLAAREMQVADIAAGEVDLDLAQWIIPAPRTKHKKAALTLPLSQLALTELTAVWPAMTVPSPFKLLRIRGFSKLKAKLDEASGVRDWRFHDLRRSARSAMTRLGVPREHAELAIGHISHQSALERVYDRHDYSGEIRIASLTWQAHVERLVTEGTVGKVIALG